MYVNAFSETGQRVPVPGEAPVLLRLSAPTAPAAKKAKTGQLTKKRNSSGLTFDATQQAAKVYLLNPLAHAHTPSGAAIKSFVPKTRVGILCDLDNDDEEKPSAVVSGNSNSTKTNCCMIFNVSSSLAVGGLDGRIHPTVSGCSASFPLPSECEKDVY
jgi:hypothetical protein